MKNLTQSENQHTQEPWAQGITLRTRGTRDWTDDEIAKNDETEQRIVFANFRPSVGHLNRASVAVCKKREDAARIVECVNACAGQSIEDVKLATAYKEDCMLWETEMMKAIGEDGVGSVSAAISTLQKQHEAMLQAIREHKVVSPDSAFFELKLPEDIKKLL